MPAISVLCDMLVIGLLSNLTVLVTFTQSLNHEFSKIEASSVRRSFKRYLKYRRLFFCYTFLKLNAGVTVLQNLCQRFMLEQCLNML